MYGRTSRRLGAITDVECVRVREGDGVGRDPGTIGTIVNTIRRRDGYVLESAQYPCPRSQVDEERTGPWGPRRHRAGGTLPRGAGRGSKGQGEETVR